MQVREYVYVDDCVSQSIDAYNRYLNGEILTIGSGAQYSVIEVVETICDLMGYDGDILREEARPADADLHRSGVRISRTMLEETKRAYRAHLLHTISFYQNRLSEVA